jgi:DNA-binding beta-propeller fold protein YncE
LIRLATGKEPLLSPLGEKLCSTLPLTTPNFPNMRSPGTAYPGGIAISADGTTAYVTLNLNNSLAVIDLTKSQPALVSEIPVGLLLAHARPSGQVMTGNEFVT